LFVLSLFRLSILINYTMKINGISFLGQDEVGTILEQPFGSQFPEPPVVLGNRACCEELVRIEIPRSHVTCTYPHLFIEVFIPLCWTATDLA
jgi:hypothetical protein